MIILGSRYVVRSLHMEDIKYLDWDVHKSRVWVAAAVSGRGGEVRQIAVFDNHPELLCNWQPDWARTAVG
jgi:hypothetical protein